MFVTWSTAPGIIHLPQQSKKVGPMSMSDALTCKPDGLTPDGLTCASDALTCKPDDLLSEQDNLVCGLKQVAQITEIHCGEGNGRAFI